MNFKLKFLKFLPSALKEWKKLDRSIQPQFKKKLAERLIKPHITSSKLSGFENHYKIKLRANGYRLVYEVIDNEFLVLVIAIGKRDKNSDYKKAKKDYDHNIQLFFGNTLELKGISISRYAIFNHENRQLVPFPPEMTG